MKHLSIREYIPVLLYTIMGVMIGIIVGAVDAIFGRVLLGITAFRGEHVTVLVPFLALAGVAILLLYQKSARNRKREWGSFSKPVLRKMKKFRRH